jgi:uncharacterized protein (DUF2141 family)
MTTLDNKPSSAASRTFSRCLLAGALAMGALLMAPATTRAEARAEGSEIRVQVTGFRSDQGQARCGLYTDESGFPREPAVRTVAAISGGRATCHFTNQVAGRYVVSVFHDENGNGKLDKNLVGMPKEGIGFSNTQGPRRLPPKFADALFGHAGAVTTVPVQVNY